MVPLLLASTGCWQARYFAPRENRNGTGPSGYAAAVYDVAHPGGVDVSGEVRLWSDGARARFTEAEEEVVDLHVGFELENTGGLPIEIDPESVVVGDLYLDGRLQPPIKPHEVRGSGGAGPGATTRFDLVFRPATTVPRDIDGFEVRFSVRDGIAEMVRQATPFAPERPPNQRVYYAAPGPYWGWGWGWGYGWGGYWGPGWGWCR